MFSSLILTPLLLFPNSQLNGVAAGWVDEQVFVFTLKAQAGRTPELFQCLCQLLACPLPKMPWIRSRSWLSFLQFAS